MKFCPKCREEYEDEEFSYCTFDGEVLESFDSAEVEDDPAPVAAAEFRPRAGTRTRGKRILGLVMAALLICGTVVAYLFIKRTPKPALTVPAQAASSAAPVTHDESVPIEISDSKAEITQLSDTELLRIVPKYLLRRFKPDETGEPRPDELRVFQGAGANYVVMVGTGHLSVVRTALDQVLVLKHEDGEFHDITRGAVPGIGTSGALGQNTHVKFDANGTDLVVRRPASSRTVVDECASCEHAYQQVTLEWKGSHFAEKQRAWDNDRYTAFYVAAEALDRRKVDRLARPLIDHLLDSAIAEGFERQGKRGWVVENLTDDVDAASAEYELKNSADRVIIRVAKVDGRWMATRIMAR
ncbi:MAG TPA: hypothetical protein VFV34_08485 [Blastocatellia bacterium]|nr:hypothetical protein [Blastocatellia bacterium]